MSDQHIIRTIEFKLYPTKMQEETLASWLRTCCWTYNRCLEHRIKAYKRRKESASFNVQSALLTLWRGRMVRLREVPVQFARGALRRVDRGMQAFFRRCKAGEKPGFPRFRSHQRYNSLEYLAVGSYIDDDVIRVPKLGRVRACGRLDIVSEQKLLRVIRRASGWYAQVVVDQGSVPALIDPQSAVGVDVGLESFATLSTGEKIANPRLLRRSESRLKLLQRRLSRRQKRSKNRRKAVRRLARQHERVAAQRKDFAHQESRKLVNRFDFIAFEKLNIKGLAASRLAKSICDAAWAIFLFCITYKAAYAGRMTAAVDPRGTSQTCPDCGAVKRKGLSERVHRCPCGCTLCRDVAAAQVILARACQSGGRVTPVEGSANRGGVNRSRAGPAKQEVTSSTR